MASREAGTRALESAGAVVLLVDDEPDVASVTSVHLERHLEDVAVVTVTGAEAALDRFGDDVDCVVSDYEMPGIDGLGLLRLVRDRDPDLPFILFTARGSEEIASEAISAGVTDYLQKGVGTDQYAVLANRIDNAVDRRRSQAEVAETRTRYRHLVEHSPNPIMVHDGEAILYANERLADLAGVDDPEALHGQDPLDYAHPDDRPAVRGRIQHIIGDRQATDWGEYDVVRPDGEVRTVEVRSSPVEYRGREASQVVFRDLTDHQRHEQRLKALHEATRDLLTAPDFEAVAGIAIETLKDVFDEPIAAVWRYDPDRNRLMSVAASERCIEIAPETDDPGPLPALGESVVEMEIFRGGQARAVQNYADHPDATTDTLESTLHFPLDDHGLMGISSVEPKEFSDSERDLIGVMARSVVAALDRVTAGDGTATGDNA